MDVLAREDLPFPQSLPEFQRSSPDDAACAAYLENARWNGGFACPRCGVVGEPFRFEALLWGFHNARSGLCFPSYEKIAERAGCARSTVAEAIKALEDAGLLTWVNRIVRIRERLFGHFGSRIRVIRTSNGYQFNDPKGAASKGFPSKSDFQSGTSIQESTPLPATPRRADLDPTSSLAASLSTLFEAVKKKCGAPSAQLIG